MKMKDNNSNSSEQVVRRVKQNYKYIQIEELKFNDTS